MQRATTFCCRRGNLAIRVKTERICTAASARAATSGITSVPGWLANCATRWR
jgi:hypothetical protein